MDEGSHDNSDDINNECEALGSGSDFTALLTSAVHDAHPRASLNAILHAIAINGAASDLDALHVIPLLIGIANPAAGEILILLGQCGNAKETVISLQESLERLVHDLNSDSDEASENAYLRLERILQLYIGAIPRLKLRKRSTSDTLRPLFSDLPRAIEKATGLFRSSEGREILRLFCTLIKIAVECAEVQEGKSDIPNVKTLCKEIFLSGLADLSSFLDVSLAQREFEASYPRLFRGGGRATEEESKALLIGIVNIGELLSYSYNSLVNDHSTGSLTLFAFMLSRGVVSTPSSNAMLSDLFLMLIAALQSQRDLDSCLFILLYILFTPSAASNTSDLDPERIIPLVYSLVPVASTSDDPLTRHISFKVIGAMLSKLPPFERMHVLHEILTESPFPAMRVSGIGLLKEAMIEGFINTSAASSNKHLFASPALLQTFGPVVMRPDPADLFAEPADEGRLARFLDSQEPKRLVECLGFYYILLMRDQINATGVRNPSQLKSAEKELLSPLRDSVRIWIKSKSIETDEHALMAFAALETALQRVDDALAQLEGEA